MILNVSGLPEKQQQKTKAVNLISLPDWMQCVLIVWRKTSVDD